MIEKLANSSANRFQVLVRTPQDLIHHLSNHIWFGDQSGWSARGTQKGLPLLEQTRSFCRVHRKRWMGSISVVLGSYELSSLLLCRRRVGRNGCS